MRNTNLKNRKQYLQKPKKTVFKTNKNRGGKLAYEILEGIVIKAT